MKTRIAKLILNTILWSAILAAVAAGLVWATLQGWAPVEYVGLVAFLAGLLVFPIYWNMKIAGTHRIVNTVLNIIGYSWVLAMIGGTFGFLIGAPFAFVSGLITFTLYEASKWVKFNYKKRNKSHHLVRS